MFEIMKPTGSRPLRRLLAFLGSCLVHAVVVIVLVVIPLMAFLRVLFAAGC